MSNQSNSEYFASRAIAERLLSEASADPRAAAIHAEMAAHYAERSLECDVNAPTEAFPAASAAVRSASAL